ncbi:putative ubiquitin carboxyl-terminal hydrolase ubh-4 [Gracilariopsis chorda]|uniref:ubiquitinyl hydrolase 1 n=1 Tax=Gracilariopsis chorda TaxID=448386 RepID=A0A2V3IW88_9FLOR|nr:putative ubiquitin carboxyl-terminal hydrolase ubh-4 [Gracilariopsis chorda]|eukprot:PXF46371.1 putative ubiquitin carboxyl-terminal hydrolase ubh-4 [Gracilariopsis chorda]
MPPSRPDEENGQSDFESQSPYPPKPSSSAATPLVTTPDGTRSSESSREATEADRIEARQILSEQGAMRKTGWLLLRTNGPNLTNVLRNAGVKGLCVRQLYSLVEDREYLTQAYILLYKWSPYRGKSTRWNPRNEPIVNNTSMEDDSANAGAEDILVCGHAMDNASATHALMMALMNIPEIEDDTFLTSNNSQEEFFSQSYDIGDDIRTLKSFLKPFDPVLRAASVCSSKVVRDAHNEAARHQFGGHPELLDEDGKVRSSLLAEELWMYSVYVPGKDKRYVYEIESMSDQARVIASCGTQHHDHRHVDGWAPVMRRPLMERVATFREHQTPFLLFAVSSSVYQTMRRRKNHDPHSRSLIYKGQKKPSIPLRHFTDYDTDDELQEQLSQEELTRTLAAHNYDTFFVEMMKLMASRGDIYKIIRRDDDDSSMAASEEEEDEEMDEEDEEDEEEEEEDEEGEDNGAI